MSKNFSMEQFFNNGNLKGFLHMDQCIKQMDSLRNKMMEESGPEMMEPQKNIHHKRHKRLEARG